MHENSTAGRFIGYPLRFRLIAFCISLVCIFVTVFVFIICSAKHSYHLFFLLVRLVIPSDSTFLYFCWFITTITFRYLFVVFFLFAIIITSFILFLSMLFLRACSLCLCLESTCRLNVCVSWAEDSRDENLFSFFFFRGRKSKADFALIFRAVISSL